MILANASYDNRIHVMVPHSTEIKNWMVGRQDLKNRVLASPKASSYIIGLVGIYLTVRELAHIGA